MEFITLGNYTLNTSAIAYINWNYKHQMSTNEITEKVRVYIKVAVGSQEDIMLDYLSFNIDSREAQALREYFKNPRVSQNLVQRLEMIEAIKG